jgi:selenocysteine lyase/cysteine desulfurase
MIAGGYPFQPGDQIISYVHEYPSNHYPWVMQRQRGVDLLLLADSGNSDLPTELRGWSMDELEKRVTARTRIIAVSHVQFASGFSANLEELGKFCRDRGIDLVVDCAQSLGCLPVYPEQYNIAALAASGWKWLMGPLGSGVMYTSEEFREKIRPTMAGPGMMRQGLDYLDHTWNPHTDGRMFEYSATPWDHVAALDAVITELFLKNSMEEIREEVFRLQDVFLQHLDPMAAAPVVAASEHRSGIIPLNVKGNPQTIMNTLRQQGVIITGPTGCLRLAPHFYMSDAQMIHAAGKVNEVCGVTA